MSTILCLKGAHVCCVEVMSIHNIVSVEDDYLKTDVCSTSRCKWSSCVHCGYFVWDSPSSHMIWYEILHDSSSTAANMASSLVGVHSPLMICVDKCHMCYVLCLVEMLSWRSSKHIGIWLSLSRITVHILQYQLHYYTHWGCHCLLGMYAILRLQLTHSLHIVLNMSNNVLYCWKSV
jgi:hypothetical protein